MSWGLPVGAVIAPHHQGLREGNDVEGEGRYFYVAYRHPHGLSWFAGTLRAPGNRTGNGMTHYILSAIRGKWIPPKPDEAIAGINYNDYLAMQLEERMWREDRNQKLSELGQIWAAQNHPGIPIRHLDPPADLRFQAAKYAHRLVARRAGVEDQLPPNHDTVRFDEEANRGMEDWDDE